MYRFSKVVDKIVASMRLDVLALRIASDWEAPANARKEWRRKRPDGTYEYRELPPEGEGRNKDEEKGEDGSDSGGYEVVDSEYHRIKNGKDFHSIVENCAKTSAHGSAVEVKDEYPDSWTMLTNKAHDATVAIEDDGSIVSVSKTPDSKEKGWAKRAVELAIKHGGKKLDCYDTVLPGWYAKAGMQVVARIPFDEKFAPKDWDYKAYSEYNNGRPDIVFMVHVGGVQKYDSKGGIKVKDYESGVEAQEVALKALGKSKEAGENKDMKNDKDSVDAVYEQLVKETMERFPTWTREEVEKELAIY